MNKTTKNQKAHLFYALLKKIPIAMRITLLLLFVLTFQLQAEHIYSQNAKISLDMKNSTIEKVLQTIEEKSDYYFLYNNRLINVDRKVSVRVRNAAISAVLERLFKSENVNYEVKGTQIILSPKEMHNQITAVVEAVQQQKKNITGTVVDAAGIPVIGANIIETGTTNGTVTDVDGRFSLDVENNAVIQISYIGFLEQSINTSGRSRFNITLLEDTKALDELIVVGYGIQKKATLTGSVSSIQPEKIQSVPATNLSQAITGRLPGVVTRQYSGEPGRDQAEIRIRGTGGALVVVDGIIGRDFNTINPNDIESLTVLKDASATAVYGARGQNGVILVTTKRGSQKGIQLNYNGYTGYQTPTREPEFLTVREQWLRNRRYNLALGQPDTWNQEYFDKIGTDPDGLTDQVIIGRNWGDENYRDDVLKKGALQTQHNLSITGGNERSNFFASVGYFNQEGMFKSSITKYDRFSLRSNYDTWFLDKNLKVSLDLFGQYANGNYPFAGGEGSAWDRLMYPMNTRPLMFSNGKYTSQSGNDNIMAMLDPDHGYHNEDGKTFNSSLQFDLKIPYVEGLSLKALASYDYYNNLNKSWTVSLPLYDLYEDVEGNIFQKPYLDQTNSSGQSINLETHLNYIKNFGYHNASALLVYSQNESKSQWFNAFKKNYITSAIDQLFMGENEGQSNTGYGYESARQGLVGRLNYDYLGKYLFETNFRYDASMNFPKGKRWGFFPSVAVGYRVSEEPFFQRWISPDIVNNLKFRLSYGIIGNDNVGVSFPYLATYRLQNAYVFGNNLTVTKGAYENDLPSFDITWETTNSLNGGIELSLFNKLVAELDIYYNRTTGILLPRSLQSSTLLGKAFPRENIGVQRRGGFEYRLNYLIKKQDLTVELGHTLSYWSSLWEYMDENTGILNIPHWRQTYALPSYGTLWSADGYYQSYEEILNNPRNMSYNLLEPGYLKYKDFNGDGKIDGYDRTQQGKSTFPQVQLGFTFNAQYKGFGLDGLLVGATQYNKMLAEYLRAGMHGISYKEQDNLWTPENPNAKYPRQGEYRTGNNYETSNFWLRDASYLRLKNLQLSYDFKNIIKSNNISVLRMYISGTNLFTLTKVEIIDPELGSDSGAGYPLMQVYSLGLNVTF